MCASEHSCTHSVGADSIRPNVLELSRPSKGESFRSQFLASPEGKLDFLISGTSEPLIKKD